MTTYTISQNSIKVTFDDSSAMFTSASELDTVLLYLSTDFLLFMNTLSPASVKKYQNTYLMIHRMQVLVDFDKQLIIDMLHNLFAILRRVNYPDFQIKILKS